MSGLFELVRTIGARPEDNDDLRLLKPLLVLWALSMSTAGLLWGAIYFVFDELLAASLPWSYSIISFLSVGLFAMNKRFEIFRLVQTLISIFIPFILGLALGGFALSGAVVLWSLMGPLGALVLYDRRKALRWLFLYLGLIVLSLALEDNLRTSNNMPEWLIGTFFVMNILGTSIVGYTVLFFFVHEKDRAFLALKAAQSRLVQAEKMSSLGQLTAGIAHEIQNPLNFINNFSKITVQLADEVAEHIDGSDPFLTESISDIAANANRIHRHGARIDGIVSNMMDHARSGGGDAVETDVNAVVENYARLVFAGIEAADGEADLKLEFALESSLPHAMIVANDLGRVIQNLVKNALDVLLRQQNSQPVVRVSSRHRDGSIEILISDNGSGVPEELRNKIFEPFFTTKPTGQGTGLGLSLSYDIVKDSLGGELRLGDSELGGATFVIMLNRR